jgi:O-antigen/teichoic acid export membrane protein
VQRTNPCQANSVRSAVGVSRPECPTLIGCMGLVSVFRSSRGAATPMSDYLSAPNTELRHRAGRAGRASIVGQVVGTAIGLIAIGVLARLVSPDDYGLFAMAGVFVSIGMTLSDGGLGTAMVMHEQVSQRQASNLFWANITLGVTMTILAAISAPLISLFYGRSELTGVSLALSLIFLATSAGVQHGALLRRRLEFGRIMVASQTSVAIGVVAAVVAATLGAGCWSLVLQVLVMIAARTVLFWVMCPWRPSIPSRGAGTREFIAFGGWAIGTELVGQLGRSIEAMLIGRVLGAGPLGVFNRASVVIMQIPLQTTGPFQAVAVAALSRVQSDPGRFVEAYRHGVLLIGAVALPIAAFAFVMADTIVAILLGAEWAECVSIVRLLVGDVVTSIVGPATVGWLFVYKRRVVAQFVWTSCCFVVKAVTLAMVVQRGVAACALAISLFAFLALIVGPAVMARGTPVRMRDAWVPLAIPAAGSAAGALAAYSLSSNIAAGWGNAPRFIMGAAAFALAYCAVWASTGRSRRQAMMLRSIVSPRR